uniref:hypothetical protein n=1 Tax=Armatimonas sp. TaxID=1872638 RepID=UPI0037532B02
MKISRKKLLLSAILSSVNYSYAEKTDGTQEWDKTDKNLLKTFEYSGKRSYIGEILKHISDTSEMSFILNPRYGVVGTPVFISCKNMSIVDFMESILSLNSIRGGYWKWEKIEKEKKIFYQLICTPTATDFPLIISKMIEDDFNKDLLQCLKAVDMDETERNNFLKDNPVASKYKFDREIPVILKSFKSLKESAQKKVLNENEKVSIPFDSLPNAQKEYISDFFSKSNGVVPQSVSFSVSRTWNGIPRLVMQWGMFVRGSIGGTPFQNKWQNELMDRWIIEGDSKIDPLEEFDKAKETSQDDKKKDIIDSVFQWARLNNINIIGHCSIATYKYQPIQGKITKAKVLGFFSNATSMHKWRGNTLLVSSIQWFIKDSKNCIIDYNMLEYIKKQEPLKITDIIHISKTLNENQGNCSGQVVAGTMGFPRKTESKPSRGEIPCLRSV